MVVVYPTFLKQENETVLVYVPDLNIYTEGTDFADAIKMARDAIGTVCIQYEDEKKELPAVSDAAGAYQKATGEKDEDFDFSDGLLSLVDCDLLKLREKLDKRSVRKNVSIPAWMSFRAEEERLNLSKILQEALRAQFE